MTTSTFRTATSRGSRAGTIVLLLVVLACIFSTVGCGGGGGGGGSVGTVPSVAAPNIPAPDNTTTTTVPTATPVSTPAPGPATVNGGTASALNPTAPPTLPSAPPPTVSKTASAPKASASSQSSSIPLIQGWNVVSFPFAQLESASGFTHKLYTYAQGTFTAVDPVNAPASIDTRFAYLAYADTSTTVTVTGTANTGTVNAVPLVQGWNLLGCPSANNLPWADMSASRLGVVRVLEEVATASQAPDASWLCRYVYGLVASVPVGEDILVPGDVLLSTSGRWVFVWQDMTLNLNVVPPSPKPVISSLSVTSLIAGKPLTIGGSGFGAPELGSVTIGGVLVPPTNITSWSDTSIVLTVPGGITSGSVVVFSSGFPSNRAAETTTDGNDASTASLSGLVQDGSGNPLGGSQILIDSGQSAVSDASGNFLVTNIPAGSHLVIVSHIGNNIGYGQFSFTAGVTKTVLVTLSALSGGGGGGTGGGGGGSPTKGTLYVNAYPYTSGGVRWYVSKILVSEYNNYTNRWSNSWYQDLGESYWSLTCSGANVGTYYTVKITYTNPNTSATQTGTWSVKLNSTSQTETHYGPYSKQ